MQASIKTEKNGSVALQLDVEAARVVFASVLFASRFHEGVVPLVQVAKEGLRGNGLLSARRGTAPCQ
jgi:hypothetical protein